MGVWVGRRGEGVDGGGGGGVEKGWAGVEGEGEAWRWVNGCGGKCGEGVGGCGGGGV